MCGFSPQHDEWMNDEVFQERAFVATPLDRIMRVSTQVERASALDEKR